MTDRDTFAAAALTGLIACMKDETVEDVCESAFGWADAMIRKRGAAPLPTLTDEERDAITVAMHMCDRPEFKTLRNLLERMK